MADCINKITLFDIKNNKESQLYELINEYLLSEYTPIVCSMDDWYEYIEQDHYAYQEQLLQKINKYIEFKGNVNELLYFYDYPSFENAMIDINGINWKEKVYHNNDIILYKRLMG